MPITNPNRDFSYEPSEVGRGVCLGSRGI